MPAILIKSAIVSHYQKKTCILRHSNQTMLSFRITTEIQINSLIKKQTNHFMERSYIKTKQIRTHIDWKL